MKRIILEEFREIEEIKKSAAKSGSKNGKNRR